MELKYKYNIFVSFFKYYNMYAIYFRYSLNCYTFKSFKLKYINICNLSLLHFDMKKVLIGYKRILIKMYGHTECPKHSLSNMSNIIDIFCGI